MWSKVNNNDNWWQKKFGDGEEDPTARYRSDLRNSSDTAQDDELPDTRTRRLTPRERREANKILRNAPRAPRKKRGEG